MFNPTSRVFDEVSVRDMLSSLKHGRMEAARAHAFGLLEVFESLTRDEMLDVLDTLEVLRERDARMAAADYYYADDNRALAYYR